MTCANCDKPECGCMTDEEIDREVEQAMQNKSVRSVSGWIQQDKDEGPVCSNCLEGLCARVWRGHIEGQCDRHDAGVEHHRDGSGAHDHCTQPTVVEVKGCHGCMARGGLYQCNRDDREIPYHVAHNSLRPEPQHPDWCPLLDKKGKPGPGIVVRLKRTGVA